MFHRPGQKTKSPLAKPLKDLLPIVMPSELLSDNKRQLLITKIGQHSGFDNARFDSFCLSLINNFAHHCQNIPETSTSYYATLGGLVDHALNRTEAALSLLREFIVIEEKGALTEEQKLWIYALFSAGILQGIGKLQLDYQVDIFDDNGQLIKQWNPLLGNMAALGSHYHYAFEIEGEVEFRKRLNILLAKLLMPTIGYNWIVSDPSVLAIWLALLNEDMRSAGTLGALLIRADAIAISRYFNEPIAKNLGGRQGGRFGRISAFVDGNPEAMIERERLTGVEFLRWLTNMLESGKIYINKAPLFSVPGGLLMSVEMFKWFVREHPEYKNWQAAQHGFLSLGLHNLGTDGDIVSRFEQANTQNMISGVVFADYAVALPETVQVHNLNTGKVTSMSATQFIYSAQFNQHVNRQEPANNPGTLEQLQPSGKWEAASDNAVVTARIEKARRG